MNKIMDGKVVAKSIYSEIKEQYSMARNDDLIIRPPKLVIIMVGNSPASEVYVRQKLKACERLGFDCFLDHITDVDRITTKDLRTLVREYNKDDSVDGIIVQLPLPDHIDKTAIIKSIYPGKDVDGLNPYNYGETALGLEFEFLYPCTARGVVKMLDYYDVDIAGKHAVVVGSGMIAGKPIAIMLSNRKATVTICNSQTKDLKLHTRMADILVVAVGKPKIITEDMVKDGAIVVDVGLSKDFDDKLSGDVSFGNVFDKVYMISPVPGGVGRLTVACLMENLLKAAITKRNVEKW